MNLRSLRWKFLPLPALAMWLATTASAHAAEGGVTPQAEQLFSLGGLSVTNSMVTTWFFSLALIMVVRMAVGQPKLIPSRGQTVVETVLTGLKGIFEPIVGSHMIDKVFPLLISFFFFILLMNWSGLIPGAGTLGIVNENGEFHTFFRPADTDLNTTLGLALVSFAAWIYFVLRYAGPGVLLKDIFGNKASKKDVSTLLYYLLTPVFFLVGFIEIISILSRLLSLPFRLFGNVFGGESLLDAMYSIFPWGLPALFYMMELLVGVVQAFVFVVLTAVYIGLICNHEGGDHDHAEESHGEAAHTH